MYDRFDPAGFRGSPFEAGRIAMNDGAEVEGDAPGDQSGFAVARGAGGAACTRWRVMALCEIANFSRCAAILAGRAPIR